MSKEAPLRYMKYVAVLAGVLLAAYIFMATVLPGGFDRDVPGRTTGAGKTSLVE